MTAIDAFLARLRDLGVALSVQGQELRCRAPKGTLTPDLTRELSARKAEIVDFLLRAQALTSGDGGAIPPAPRGGDLPLSFGQQRLWFLDRLEGPSATYTMPMAVRLEGDLDIPALERALAEIVRRHEVLRTNFVLRGSRPVLVIHDTADCPLAVRPLPPGMDEDAAIAALVAEEAGRCFDLARDRLVQAALVPLASGHLFLLTMHHIVSDGWSLDVLVRELTALYGAFRRGRPSPLAPLPLQYADVAHWQRQRLQGDFLAAEIAYWRARLAGIPEVLALPTDRPRPPVQTYRGASVAGVLDAALTRNLRELGQSAGTTLYMTLLAGFAILLGRYGNQTDVVVGTPVANRPRTEMEGLIGLFINTLAVRLDLSGGPTVRALLDRVRLTGMEALEHQELPFEQLVEELRPARALSYSPLIQVSFQLRAPSERIEAAGLTLIPVEQEETSAKFDLSLTVQERAADLAVFWNYNPDLFDAATIVRMMGHYRVLLAGMAAAPDRPVPDLAMMDADERRAVLHAPNQTRMDYPRERTFLDLFDAAAARVPHRVAVSFGGQEITYAALRARADALAAHLRSLGVGPETRVALCVERSAEMVTALLAILKAGGAYIPLDPAYPPDRLALVIDDARPALAVTQRHLRHLFPAGAVPVLCLDGDWTPATDQPPVACPAAPDNTAYVIYTSGSTGRPKGVAVGHRALLNFLLSMQREPGFAGHDTLLAVTTISFDIAALELYLPLITGGRLVVADRETTLDGRALQAALSRRAVTCMQATPATWRLLVDTGWRPPAGFTALCGGEALPRPLSRALLGKGIRLWNLYGPTETTVWSAVSEVPPAGAGEEGVEPVGHPIANTRIHVLGPEARPLPVGVPGELYIGGDGLARGYLNKPGMTAERYVPDPFATEPGSRLYRTGDLVRRLAAGPIEFLGRIDHQVKIRGFRIELGEIETALRRHDGVRDAIVLAREDVPGDKRLVAYVVASGTPAPDAGDLRAFLRDAVPAYMIPAAFVMMDAYPLTPNGKADRKALPPPDAGQPARRGAPSAPQTALEARVAAVWQQVLRLDAVGIDDTFFDLGGHSLLLTQVHEALRGETARPFPLITLFQYPTVRTLAAWLAAEDRPVAVAAAATAPRRTRDIAIIGLSGRFPGADDLETFWDNLREGRESIRFFTKEELLAAGMPADEISHPAYVPANGCLSDVAGFDAGFFGVTPSEAEVMDPQHRLFLETAWHTLENAGYAGNRTGARIGVFAGCSHAGYLAHNLLPSLFAGMAIDVQQIIFTNDKDFLPTRTSYALDLKGPSINVQTACSTSLVALHMACSSLLAGECGMALAGAVAIKLPQVSGYTYHEGMIQSPDGHCRAFDADANGTTWGSGAAAVLLKPLDAALADRDTIHAVIKGSAINNDGSLKVSFTAPGVEAQAEVIATAQALAGVTPADISYVETHGTGTRFGDPIEVAALTRAFRAGTDAVQACALGAVKTNIGHLDTAAGMAGLIKTVLALQHRQIPPTLHFRRGNPDIDFANSPFFVNDRLRDWADGAGPRRAGVSSFGIGGTNAHVIVEEAPARTPSSAHRSRHLLLLSARSPAALDRARAALATHLERHPETDPADAAYTLAVGRRAFPHRTAVVCRDGAEAVRRLSAPDPRPAAPAPATPPGVVFLFPGQGSQYAGMGAELYRTEPVFRTWIDRGADRLRERLGLDLRTLLHPAPDAREAADAHLSQTWLTQPALFLTEYALAQVWMAWGITPGAMIGHSLGEYTAACLAGVFDFDTALDIVAERGRLIWDLPGGAMLAVARPADEVAEWLSGDLGLAGINGVQDCTVSGPAAAIEALAERLAEQQVPCRRLRTSHAFHSAMMDPVLAPFTAALGKVRLNPPALPFVSNLTGTWITAEQATDPGYWARHLRHTVRFADGIAAALDDPAAIPLEVGPGTVLTALTRRSPAIGSGRPVLPSFARPTGPDAESEAAGMLDSLGRLWAAGAAVDWDGFHTGDRVSRIPLPGYAFERQRYFIEDPGHDAFVPRRDPHRKLPLDEWFTLPAWKPSLAPRLDESTLTARPGAWLVFGGGSALERRIVERLAGAGCSIVTAVSGDRYERNGDAFTIRPSAPEDYAALVTALDGRPLRMVLHAWPLSVPEDAGFDVVRAAGYDSLLFLGRALAGRRAGEALTIAVLARHLHEVGGGDTVWPEAATVLGPCLVLPQEVPELTVRCLDVPGGHAAGLADTLLADLLGGAPDPLVAYRGSRRFVPDFEAVTLDPLPDAAAGWRAGGVYLITGGLGKVGLMLARFLAETVRARLVLAGSSPFPAREEWDRQPADGGTAARVRRLREIEALGAAVLTVQADVADEGQMRVAFALAEERFGPVHGVIHAAGRLDDASYLATITEVGAAETRAQFAPKVHGLRVLERVLAGREVDFCLVISSTSAVLGGYGFAAYAAANAFADAFVTRRSQQGGTRWLSAGCDGWRFDGPAESGPAFTMTPAESLEALSRVVARVAGGRVILSTGDIRARYDHWVRRIEPPVPVLPAVSKPEARHERPTLVTAYAAPANGIEARLVALWQELFGFTTVGVHDNFFDLGGDSLLAIRHMTMVKESFGTQLPLTALLAKPTIHDLAQALGGPASAAAFSPLVPIQPEGTGTPFFCVPGTGGTVLYLRALALGLKEHGRPFYGLQASGLDGAAPPLDRIEDIAAQNVAVLKEVQPHGPYLLGGHSFGSWVAFEMARQLLAAGERVAGVAVLDTGVPGARDRSAMGEWDNARWVLTIADILSAMFGKPHGLTHGDVADRSWDGQVAALARAMEAMGAVQAGTDAAEIRGFAEVYRAQARIAYQPPADIKAPIALFRAHEPLEDFLSGMPEALRDDPAWGWGDFSAGAPVVEPVPGNHLTMMTPPHAAALATRLHAVLSAWEARGGRVVG